MSDDQYARTVPGVLERLREALKPLANLAGLQVKDDSDGCSCCAGLIVSDPTRTGGVRLYFSSRGSEGKHTRLKTGWKTTVDIDEGEFVRDKVAAPTEEMTSPRAVVGFFLEQLPRSLLLLKHRSPEDVSVPDAARLERQRQAFEELRKLEDELEKYRSNASGDSTPTADGHRCDGGDFDRSVCPEPCGTMHSYCSVCGTLQDECANAAS